MHKKVAPSTLQGMDTGEPVNQVRLAELAEELRGTCKSLEDFATEEEQNDTEFLKALDEQVFCCEECGWWFEIGDLSEDSKDPAIEPELICRECRPDYADTHWPDDGNDKDDE